MRCRDLLIVLLALPVTLAVAAPAASGPRPLQAGRTIFVVQPDPRLCPSPLCGGYWVARANHARTRCHDGLLRPRCYVARTAGWPSGEELPRGIPARSLVRAALGAEDVAGVGTLGVLIVRDLWTPLSARSATGSYFRIRDLGIRCIRAPCFSLLARRVNRGYSVTISDLDLAVAGADAKALRQAEAALATPEGLLVTGRVSRTPANGRLLDASQVFLREQLPRA